MNSHTVRVIDRAGKELHPCTPARARILLKQQKAVVVRKKPYTIKLTYKIDGGK